MIKTIKKLTNYQIIALAYISVILIGSLLLTLPISNRNREWTPFIDSLFTSTSATCVTGLIVYDTYTHWSGFGQAVILILIQIGGVGFMTIMTLLFMSIKHRISLSTKTLFAQSTIAENIGSVPILVRQIAIGTVCFELIGALLLSIRFIPIFGFGQGLWTSIFHSVSAFCNAGFDLMGVFGEFGSLIHFVDDLLVNLTIMSLIVIGGLGFLVWGDILHCKFNFKKFKLHTYIVLITTVILIVLGAVAFLIFEWNYSMKDLTVGEKILASFFQSITPRTAGFNTVDQSALSDSGSLLTMIYMFIGGSSGSTAGGIKTTTFAIIILTIVSHIRRKNSINIAKRRIEENTVHEAIAILSIYLVGVMLSTLVICAYEPYSLKEVLYEVCSAIGTVGLTMGITPSVTTVTKLILALLMYGGRVGVLTLAMVFANRNSAPPLERPTEKIIIG